MPTPAARDLARAPGVTKRSGADAGPLRKRPAPSWDPEPRNNQPHHDPGEADGAVREPGRINHPNRTGLPRDGPPRCVPHPVPEPHA